MGAADRTGGQRDHPGPPAAAGGWGDELAPGAHIRVHDAKSRLRTRIRARRRLREDPGVGDGLLQVARSAGLLDPRGRAGPLGTITVAAYLAMPGEPDPGALVAAARASGGTVLLPIPHAGRVLGWAVDTGQHARSARLPVVVPESPEVGRGAAALLAAGVRIVLAPALAVTTDGARLGNGGGYYDTLLAQLAGRIEVMAVVHDDEVLAPGEIPTEPHDARVSAALTPTRLLRLG